MDINLTDRAKTELERLLAKKESSGKPVRIYVAGVG
jgi:Fe-S cluster assembly iron-binding protein IscA